MSSNCLIATLHFGSRVFNDVVFTIRFMAASICDDWDPNTETAVDSELCQRYIELHESTCRKPAF